MAKLYEQKWWQKLWGKEKQHEQKIDVAKNIDTIHECLKDVNTFVTKIQTQLDKVQELEQERKVAHKKDLLDINLQTQAKEMDSLLSAYETLQTDIDLNGIRLKRISKEFLKTAAKEGHKELIQERKKNYLWNFDW